MHISALPRTIKNQIAWTRILRGMRPGDSLAIDAGTHDDANKIRHGAIRRLNKMGLGANNTITGTVLTVRVTAQLPVKRPPKSEAIPSSQGAVWEITKTTTRIRETREKIAHWKLQQTILENHAARVDAGARVLLWESQLRTLESKRQALSANLKTATA
jgi:hypothetical protein